jgi:Fe-S-cluster containining protein
MLWARHFAVAAMAPPGPEGMRRAPSVEQLLAHWLDLCDRIQRGEPDAATVVPCAGCSACCRGAIPIDPTEDTTQLSVTPPNAAGRRYLQRTADGACVHLGPAGCSVYPHRPQACRRFDCRLAAAFGITPPRADHPFPVWSFAASTSTEAALNALAQGLGMAEVKRATAAGEAWSASSMLPGLVIRYFQARSAAVATRRSTGQS